MRGKMAIKPSSAKRVTENSVLGHAPYDPTGEAVGQAAPEGVRVGADPNGHHNGSASPTTVTQRPDPEAPRTVSGLRQRISMTLALIRSNPTGRIALKVGVGVLGAVIVAIGFVLIPLPGPGWLIVFAGLAVWGVEFHWAKRLLAFARRHVQRWTRWAKRQTWPVRFAIAGVGLVFVGAVAIVSLKVGLGIDVIASFLRYLATT
jgi:uncharacterized protein (TIGR02611 family)